LNIRKQHGHILALLLPLILLGAVGSLLCGFLSHLIPAGGPFPYIFVSFFLLPITPIWPLLKDAKQLRGQEFLTSTEKKRLEIKVKQLETNLTIFAVMLFVFGVMAGLLLYLSSVNYLLTDLTMRGIGFGLGCSIFIFIYLIRAKNRIEDYTIKLKSRFDEATQARNLLRKTSSKRNGIPPS